MEDENVADFNEETTIYRLRQIGNAIARLNGSESGYLGFSAILKLVEAFGCSEDSLKYGELLNWEDHKYV